MMKLTRPDKIGIVGISLILVNILLQTVIFPSIIKSQVKKKVALKNGWPMRESWSKLPFPMELHWYIFNVTNPEEINKGGKPKLRDVGPFVYDMWQEKINQEDHEEDDTLSYTMRNTYFFNPAKSNGLDDNNELMVPQLSILGLPNKLMRERPFLMPLASRAVDSVLKNPQSMFVFAKARTFIYDGFVSDCSGVEDFHGKSLCNEMGANYDDYFLLKVGNMSYATSLWGPFNGTTKMGKRLRIKRGIKNIKQVGQLKEYLEKKNFSVFKIDRCDAFRGTDFTIFPPFLNEKKKESFFATHTLFCRNFEFTYDSSVEYEGLKLLRYTTIVGTDGRSKPEDECFCANANDCPPKGVFDLYKCLGVPLIMSSPHFYQGDQFFIRAVDGIKPNKEKHMTIIDIDPLTGYAVRVNQRYQANINIMPLKKYRLMQTFPELLLPLVWLDQQTLLPYSLIQEIKACYRTVMISNVFNYLLLIGGLGMCGYAGYHQYKLRREKQLNTITELSPENSVKHTIGEKQIPTMSASIPTNID